MTGNCIDIVLTTNCGATGDRLVASVECEQSGGTIFQFTAMCFFMMMVLQKQYLVVAAEYLGLIPTNFLPCSTRNRPIHANSLNKLFEAVVNDKPGIKFAYGDNAQVFDLFAKDPVSSCAMLMSHKVSDV
jgi:hypothetical protein